MVVYALTEWSREFFLLEEKQTLLDRMGSQGTKVKDFFSRQIFATLCNVSMKKNTINNHGV